MQSVPLCGRMELSWEESLLIFPVKKTGCTVYWDGYGDSRENIDLYSEKQMGLCKTPEHRLGRKIAGAVTKYAKENHADIIVFEYLETKGKISGKKNRNCICGENGISRSAVNIRYIEMEYGYRGSVRGTPAGLHMMEQEPLPVIRKITACVYFRQENDIIAICQHRTI